MDHGREAQTCGMDMELIDIGHGHGAWTWGMDIDHGHEAQTWGMDMELIDMGHGQWTQSTWTSSMNIQHRQCNMDIQY